MPMNFFRIDGWPAAPALARDLLALRAAHDRECTCDTRLRVRSIYRTRSEQHDIFVRRYRKGAFSPWGDYRRYQGAIWGRIAAGGPVASPDKVSNHMRGLAVDFAIGQGSVCFWWLRRNAHRWNFNWVEGKSIDEWWHWGWHVRIVPDRSTPDPWEGRGAPDPVPATDPGMTLEQLLGGPATAGPSKPVVVPDLPKGKTMADVKQIHCTVDDKPKGKIHQRALLIPGTAWAVPFTESGATFANTAADQFDTGDSRWYTKSMFNAFIRAAERCAPTKVAVELAKAEG